MKYPTPWEFNDQQWIHRDTDEDGGEIAVDLSAEEPGEDIVELILLCLNESVFNDSSFGVRCRELVEDIAYTESPNPSPRGI